MEGPFHRVPALLPRQLGGARGLLLASLQPQRYENRGFAQGVGPLGSWCHRAGTGHRECNQALQGTLWKSHVSSQGGGFLAVQQASGGPPRAGTFGNPGGGGQVTAQHSRNAWEGAPWSSDSPVFPRGPPATFYDPCTRPWSPSSYGSSTGRGGLLVCSMLGLSTAGGATRYPELGPLSSPGGHLCPGQLLR